MGLEKLPKEERVELARRGGASVAPENRSFSKDRQLAARAGSKGGKAVAPEKRTFSRDPVKAREMGRKGGLAAARALRKRRKKAEQEATKDV